MNAVKATYKGTPNQLINMRLAMSYSSNEMPNILPQDQGPFIVYRTVEKNDSNPSNIKGVVYEDRYQILPYDEAKVKYDEWLADEDTYTAGIAKIVESTDHVPDDPNF